jgi:hypothetical protein
MVPSSRRHVFPPVHFCILQYLRGASPFFQWFLICSQSHVDDVPSYVSFPRISAYPFIIMRGVRSSYNKLSRKDSGGHDFHSSELLFDSGPDESVSFIFPSSLWYGCCCSRQKIQRRHRRRERFKSILGVESKVSDLAWINIQPELESSFLVFEGDFIESCGQIA